MNADAPGRQEKDDLAQRRGSAEDNLKTSRRPRAETFKFRFQETDSACMKSGNRGNFKFLSAPLRLCASLLLFILAIPTMARAQSPVTIAESDTTFLLDNGIVTALVSKRSGDLISMKYHGVEMLATIMDKNGQPDLAKDPPGANTRGFAPFTDHQYGFWSHDTTSPHTVAKITIDPAAHGGERGEVSVKGFSDGKPMGKGTGGSFISDIEIRYCLGRNDSGVYTYCIFDHQPEYGDGYLNEARFCVKLNNDFDWMLVDAHHNFLYPQSAERGDDKYNYTTVQYEHPAFGWASTTRHVGFFFVNASVEYLAGPPTKVEFLCHRDTNEVAAPCVLNYWRSSHYGGSSVDVAQGEHWTKVIGPFLLYCNSGENPQTIWANAIAQQNREKSQWPYAWVSGVDYPVASERGSVSGKLTLNDPAAAYTNFSHLMVGLSAPDYTIPTTRPAATNSPRDIEWQNDAKHYEFWVRGSEDGRFTIPNVRPGMYTLHAFADGVLGEFSRAPVAVASGGKVDLGEMQWQPVRNGRQLWEIGIPNRNGSEFAWGDNYYHDGMAGVYAQLFPDDVNFTIGKSDYHKDWFYEQVPHLPPPGAAAAAAPAPAPAIAPTSQPGRARGGRGAFGRGRGGPGPAGGRATPWKINFELPSAPSGKATLRVAIATSNAREIDINVNGKDAGKVDELANDSAIGRNGISGIWYERAFTFDAAMMKAGPNVMTLTVPAGGGTAGVIYDYLRLELDETK